MEVTGDVPKDWGLEVHVPIEVENRGEEVAQVADKD